MMKRFIAISSIGGKQTSLILQRCGRSLNFDPHVQPICLSSVMDVAVLPPPQLIHHHRFAVRGTWPRLNDPALVNSLTAPWEWLQHSSL